MSTLQSHHLHSSLVPTNMLPLSPRQQEEGGNGVVVPGKAVLTGTTGATDGGALLPTLQSLLYPQGTTTTTTSSTTTTLPTKLLFGTGAITTTTVNTTSTAAEIAAEALRISRQSQQQRSTSTSTTSSNSDMVLLPKDKNHDTLTGANTSPKPSTTRPNSAGGGSRLNKFVKRLHDMLQAEKDGGVIEWRKGLLVLHSTADFAKHILPKFFNTKNFKTFRRQLNYYGFVHVRSFSTAAANTTTALWVNQELAEQPALSADIASVLTLKRVEPCEMQKTAEGRRQRKEMALHTVEEDLKMDPKTLQLEQIQNAHLHRPHGRRRSSAATTSSSTTTTGRLLPTVAGLPASTTGGGAAAGTAAVPLEIAFAQARSTASAPTAATASLSEQRRYSTTIAASAVVVSDDTQSRTSSSSGQASEGDDRHHRLAPMDEDSLGAANLLLMLSRVRR